MGYLLPPNAPRTLAGGNTYALAATANISPVGVINAVGTFILAGADWNQWVQVVQYVNDGDMLAAVRSVGGINAFAQNCISKINAAFAANGITAVFASSRFYQDEPATDQQCLDAINVILSEGAFKGAEIPAKMRQDYDAYWTGVIQVGDSRVWSNGSITKLGAAVALYADPTGVPIYMAPNSDLNAIAKGNAHIAAAWKAAYGFVPA